MKQNIKREEKQRTNNSWYYLLYKQKPLRAWKNLKKMLVIICGCASSRVRVCCRRCTMRLAGMVWRAGLLLFYIQYLMRLVGLAIFWDFSLEDEKFYPPDRARCDGGNGRDGINISFVQYRDNHNYFEIFHWRMKNFILLIVHHVMAGMAWRDQYCTCALLDRVRHNSGIKINGRRGDIILFVRFGNSGWNE